MAKTFKERLMERLPGTRTSMEEPRTREVSVPLVERVTGFLQEFKTEMKKVTWPGRKDTAASTLVVIMTVMIIVVFLGLVDYVLGWAVFKVLNF